MWPDVDEINESFGNYLKREREYRHITLDEVSKATKIQKYYLDAIERDEYKLLPGEAYLKGFVRSYAKYIGIEPDDAILRLEAFLKQNEAKKTPVPVKKNIIKKSKGIYIVIAIVGVLIITLIGIIKRDREIEIKKERRSTGLVQNKGQTHAMPSETYAIQPGTETNTVDLGQQKKEPLRLNIKAREKTWIMVRRDNEKPFDVILWEGNVANWYAEERISLRIGNAQGVEIIYNGVPLRNLGEKGEVVSIVLPDDLQKYQ